MVRRRRQDHAEKPKAKKGPKFKGMVKATQLQVLNAIYQVVESKNDPKTGKLPYGFLTKIIEEQKQAHSWLTRDMYNGYRKRRKIKEAPTEPLSLTELPPTDTGTNISIENDPPKKAGRPKGTTEAAKRARHKQEQDLVDDVAVEYAKLKKKAGDAGKNVAQNTLKTLIDTAKIKYNLKDFSLSQDTIWSQVKRNRTSNVQRGHKSPMDSIEAGIVEIVKASNRARNPMKKRDIKSFANSLIEGSCIAEGVGLFKRQNIKVCQTEEQCDGICGVNKLGNGWYNGFRGRWKHELGSGNAINQDQRRQDWTTWEWVDDMYDHVYALFLETGHAVMLDEPEWQDANGERVDSKAEALGLKVTMQLKYPERVLVVDECGDNTNMKKDKKAGNEKFVVAKGDRAQISCSSDDNHFTTMGFTNLLGTLVLMVVIIAKASPLTLTEKYGLDLSAEWVGAESNIDANTGPGRRYPGGPVCHVNGIEVPAFVTNSESGGITPEILAAAFAKMDKIRLFPRSEGVPDPFVLLDGHGSRFQPPFLEYILDKSHPWEVCLGLPNGTHVWQVGDSKQQNGAYKRELILAKRTLIQEKQGLQ
jgi:hypothetical protein